MKLYKGSSMNKGKFSELTSEEPIPSFLLLNKGLRLSLSFIVISLSS